jgi:hypothetical protein
LRCRCTIALELGTIREVDGSGEGAKAVGFPSVTVLQISFKFIQARRHRQMLVRVPTYTSCERGAQLISYDAFDNDTRDRVNLDPLTEFILRSTRHI